jgi:OmpA-OmpF porin, OOP family
MKKSKFAAAAIALMALGAGAAHAELGLGIGKWYGGIDVGSSRFGAGNSELSGALANQGIAGAASTDRNDTSWGLNLGFRVNPTWAVEGGYTDFGKLNYSAAVAAPADTIQGDYKANAVSLAGVGSFPLSESWSVYGKAGLARTHVRLNANSTNGATAPSSATENGTGLLIGAGTTYDFTKNVFGKLAWDRYTRVGDSSTGRGDVDLLSAGVGLRF